MSDYDDFFGIPIRSEVSNDLSTVFYADQLINIYFTPYVVKLTFARADSVTSSSKNKTVLSISGQVTLPVGGFVNALLFMQTKFEEMKKAGIVTDDLVTASAPKPPT